MQQITVKVLYIEYKATFFFSSILWKCIPQEDEAHQMM